MKKKSRILVGLMALMMVIFSSFSAHAQLNVVKSAAITTVSAEVAGVEETLAVAIKSVSNNQTATAVSFPAGNAVASAAQYLEVSFQSNAVAAAVIISTDNRRRAANGTTLANPAFKSGSDGLLGTGDDETFEPQKGVSGGGLVGTDPKGHGFVVPLLWAVFDDPEAGGYAFQGNLNFEGVVTDKAQTHVFEKQNGQDVLVEQLFDSAKSLAYATVVTGMVPVDGLNKGQIASFPRDIDGPQNGNKNGLRSATSPIYIYLGVDYKGAPKQGYATSTLALELIHQ